MCFVHTHQLFLAGVRVSFKVFDNVRYCMRNIGDVTEMEGRCVDCSNYTPIAHKCWRQSTKSTQLRSFTFSHFLCSKCANTHQFIYYWINIVHSCFSIFHLLHFLSIIPPSIAQLCVFVRSCYCSSTEPSILAYRFNFSAQKWHEKCEERGRLADTMIMWYHDNAFFSSFRCTSHRMTMWIKFGHVSVAGQTMACFVVKGKRIDCIDGAY